MTDVNANGTMAQEVTLLDKDGEPVAVPFVIVEKKLDTGGGDIAGIITVTTAGTPVTGSSVVLTNGVYIRSLNANTGEVYIGNHATDMRSNYGFPLQPNDLILVQVSNLNELKFDAAVSGEKLAWLKA